MNLSGPKVINLGIGNPDLAPHDTVTKNLCRASLNPKNHGYQSYNGAAQLREAIADWYARFFNVNLDSDREILPLIGSKEGIMHLSMTFLNPGDKVLEPDPGYPAYRSASILAGATVVSYDLTEANHWEPDFENLERQDLTGVKMMWINYPHMPTGAAASIPLFKNLIAFAKRHQILLCHDNPYGLIQPSSLKATALPLSILAIEGAKEVAVELNSLSKSHNMAGWRIGMLMGDEEIINQVMRFKSNMDSGMFLPLQLAATQALALDKDWHDALNQKYAKRKEKALALLKAIGCTCKGNQQGLFLWAKVPAAYQDGYAFSDHCLNEARVLLTPGGIFGENGRQYIRLSLCSSTATLAQAAERLNTSFCTTKTTAL